MTKIDVHDKEELQKCGQGDTSEHITIYEGSHKTLGAATTIRRLLPRRHRRMVGPWCFLDHFGPVAFEDRQQAMWVGPHPHIGLQTVTWLLEGEVLHRDSVGSVQVIRPGQLNVMTSGKGISHSEETPEENSGHMHGLQFWVALPEESRNVEPHFEHVPQVPSVNVDGITFNVFAGSAFGVTCPAKYYSPIVGFDAHLVGSETADVPLNSAFEHAVVVTSGEVQVDGETVSPGFMGYLGTNRESVCIEHSEDAHIAIVGGEPFGEEIYMWWNFVARNAAEIREARDDWAAGRRFPDVQGFEGKRLEVPEFAFS